MSRLSFRINEKGSNRLLRSLLRVEYHQIIQSSISPQAQELPYYTYELISFFKLGRMTGISKSDPLDLGYTVEIGLDNFVLRLVIAAVYQQRRNNNLM